MPFVDDLRVARYSPVASLHEFKLNSHSADVDWHCFFEGQTDSGFYVPIITRYVAQERLRTYRCGNKKNVLDTFDDIRAKQPLFSRALFFVDRDLAGLVPSENCPSDKYLYVTDTYSVENVIATEAVLDRILRELFRISGVSFDFSVICHAYSGALIVFHRTMVPVMAWIVAAMRRGTRPNLNNVQLQHLVILDEDNVPRWRMGLKAVSDYLVKVTGSPAAPVGEWRRAVRDVRRLDPPSFVRGKFVAWFFLQFVARTQENLRMVAEEVGGHVALRTLLHARNFVEVLGPRSMAPQSLSAFLDGHRVDLGPSDG